MMKCIFVQPNTSVTSQKIQPMTFQIDAKKLTLLKHHADPHARSPTSATQQSTSVRGVGGWNGRGMVW
jgi:hypothetical protein